MANAYLDQLAQGKLLDPGAPFLPGGKKKPDPKSPQTPDEKLAAKGQRQAKRSADEQRLAGQVATLLATYAATDVPPQRVLDHIGIPAITAILKVQHVIRRGMTLEDRTAAIHKFLVDGLAKHGRRIDPADLVG